MEHRIGARVLRDHSRTGDYVAVVSGKNTIFDMVGANMTKENFRPGAYEKPIIKHVRMTQGVDRVVVILSRLSQSQRISVINFIRSLPKAEQARIIIIGR